MTIKYYSENSEGHNISFNIEETVHMVQSRSSIDIYIYIYIEKPEEIRTKKKERKELPLRI